MKTLYVNHSGYITIDNDNNTVDHGFGSSRESISRIFLAKEPMKVVYSVGTTEYTTDVDTDDIIIMFYSNAFNRPVVVAKSKDWADNIKEYELEEQNRKEEWAKNARNLCENCEKCEDCENC